MGLFKKWFTKEIDVFKHPIDYIKKGGREFSAEETVKSVGSVVGTIAAGLKITEIIEGQRTKSYEDEIKSNLEDENE